MSSPHYLDLTAVAHQAMAMYGFIARFPPNVLEDAQSVDRNLENTSLGSSIRDLRTLLWSSIDNIDSKDLDQIEYCERGQNREIRVLVGIADVDHYVPKGSSVDRHAGHNGTSVYTGVVTFPMLPEALCNDTSSLVPGEDRLAVVIEFFVKRDGSIRRGEVFRALVRNHAKLVYEEIGEWLEGHRELPDSVSYVNGLEAQLRLQDEATERLHKFRMASGALELETIEPRAVVKDGEVQDLIVIKKNRARSVIENFMVAANGTMVAFIEKNGKPHIQRVVRTPERWEKIRDVALSLGTDLPTDPDPLSLSDFLAAEHRRDPDRFPDLSLTIVKLLGSGEYVLAEPGRIKLGHFGLAVQDYTHSTAPNRRYIDVVIQRIIKSILSHAENMPYNKSELESIAAWCTERDQAAKKVERLMRKVAAAMLLTGRVGQIFDGIVTGASEKGTYVRIVSPPAEGRVVRGEEGMDVGEKVRVRLINVEPDKGYIDFEAADKSYGGVRSRRLRPPHSQRPFYHSRPKKKSSRRKKRR